MYTSDVLNVQNSPEIDWFGLDVLWGDLAETQIAFPKPRSLKRKAASYMEEYKFRNGITKTVKRELLAKAKKIRVGSRKAERTKVHMLTQQVNWYLNYHKY